MKRILIMIIILMMMPFVSSVEEATPELIKEEADKEKSFDCEKESMVAYKKGIMEYKKTYYGKEMMHKGNWILVKVIGFALVVFIFSVIFWTTHNWLVKKKKR